MSFVHLVSGQTLPNLLPLLAAEPASVVQIMSAGPRFEMQANALQDTLCSHYGWEVSRVRTHVLQSVSPEMVEICEALKKLHEQEPIEMINFTGGTKLMSIGAHAFAREMKIPSMYVDTDSRQGWVDGKTAPWNVPIRPLTEVAHSLSVPVLLSAHGLKPENYREEKLEDHLMTFGSRVAELTASDSEGQLGRYLTESRKRLHRDGGVMLEKKHLRNALDMGLPVPENDLVHAFLEAACAARLVHAVGSRYYLDPAPAYFDATSSNLVRLTKRVWRILEGGWWELAVLNAMQQSGRFADIRWSVQSGTNDDTQTLGENDIVAIDRHRLSLSFVSCKVSDRFLHKPLEHVFATRERAETYGGTYARPVFVFNRTEPSERMRMFRLACKVSRARLIESESALHEWLHPPRTPG